MHPSRLVALCCFGAGALFVALTVVGGFQPDLEHGLRLVGGATLLVGSLNAAVRCETDPLVAEYGPRTYLIVAAALAWIGTLAARLAL